MPISLHDISELLQLPVPHSSSENVYWLGQRGEDAYPFVLHFPLTGIICANWSHTLAGWAKHCDIYSLEKIGQRRVSFSSSNLQTLLSDWTKSSHLQQNLNTQSTQILPYMSVKPLHSNQQVLGPEWNLVSTINNKQIQRNLFQQWGFFTPKTLMLDIHLKISDLSKFFQKEDTCIVIPCYGSLGKGVRRLAFEDVVHMQKIKMLDSSNSCLASKFIEGISVNTSIVITKNEVILGWPSVQILGEPICHAQGEFIFCGSNFSATHDFDKRDLNSLFQQAVALGKNYAHLGYVGFLGADWVLDKGGKWWLIEVNPRLQGSTLALSLFEMHAGYPSLLSYGFTNLVKKKLGDRFYAPIFGFQLNMYAKEAAVLENYTFPSKNLGCGEKWYISGIPTRKTFVDQSAEIIKIIAPNSSVSLDNNQLTLSERVKITRILKSIELKWKSSVSVDNVSCEN